MQTDEDVGKVAAAVPVIICILSGVFYSEVHISDFFCLAMMNRLLWKTDRPKATLKKMFVCHCLLSYLVEVGKFRGIKTIHRQDNSPTRFLRQFTDRFWVGYETQGQSPS